MQTKRYCLVLISLLICFSYTGCKKLFKDDDLSLPRENYYGDAIKLDGYYYHHGTNSTYAFFLYRNGVYLNAHGSSKTDLDVVEREMIEYYDKIRSWKYSWGVFVIRGNILEVEGWRSVGWTGKLPVYKSFYIIENDTTLRYIKDIIDGRETEKNEIYHFKQFSHKPDSTNVFIK